MGSRRQASVDKSSKPAGSALPKRTANAKTKAANAKTKVAETKGKPKGPDATAPRPKPAKRRTDKSNAEGESKPKAPVKLLSGGNPQIAKGDGDAPVQAYIDALPGWKSEMGRRLDALIVSAVPEVRKAVKWNSPFYGLEDNGWFLGLHAFTKYLKLAFFQGAALTPLPPGSSKSPEVRYLDIREDDELDTEQLKSWVRQAAALPGWKP